MPIRRPCGRRSRPLGSGLRILAVRVLTSYDEPDLMEAGYEFTVPTLVAERAEQAPRSVWTGSSARPRKRQPCAASWAGHGAGDAGRPAQGTDDGDQKRVMTPPPRSPHGADHVVVARPITAAPDPKAAAEAIQAEIASADADQRPRAAH